MGRYDNRIVFNNSNPLYRERFKGKRDKSLGQYMTAPTPDVTSDLYISWEIEEYIWKYNDTYQALASKYYGDMTEWWRIAWFNKEPSETTLKIGDVLMIPLNIGAIKEYLGY